MTHPPDDPIGRPDSAHEPAPPPIGAQTPPQFPGQLGRASDFPGGSDRQTMTVTSDERTMAILCHVLAIFTSFIGPLIIWLIKRDESAYVDAHGRAVLNFVITMILYSFALAILFVLAAVAAPLTGGLSMILMCPAYLAMIGLGIWILVIEIMRAMEASNGRFRPYPLAITFLKHPEAFEAYCLIGPTSPREPSGDSPSPPPPTSPPGPAPPPPTG